ncbi:MAG: DUF3368 domain-containing protein [Candidatus Tectomicrobia bacterium]
MLVVADTTSLRYLILIAHADVLHTLYGRVLIPQAVFDELQHVRTPPAVHTWLAQLPQWLEIHQVHDAPDETLQHLDPGEHEAIVLAQALHADLLLMDDWDGRQEAERRHLAVTGTLGVLERASIRGLLDLPTAIARLQMTNFYVRDEIVQELLARDSARKSTQG